MKSDVQIQKDVIEEIKWNRGLNLSDIGVCCKNGVVTLSGQVDTFAEKVNAEKAAKKVFGVMAVAEDIHVGMSASNKETDAEIADMVLTALKWNSAVQEEKIKITVENGYVTLEGEADWEYQRSQAKKALEFLPSIKGIFNLITLKACATPNDVKTQIQAAFQRHASLDSRGILVSVIGNKAVLRGTVRSITEKEDAEHAARAARGIVSVENNLAIEVPEIPLNE